MKRVLTSMKAGSMSQALNLDFMTALAVRSDGNEKGTFSVIVKTKDGAQGLLPGTWDSAKEADDYVFWLCDILTRVPDRNLVCAKYLLKSYNAGEPVPAKKRKGMRVKTLMKIS